MNNISEIVDIVKHPIDNSDYINLCKKRIYSNSILILENFLKKDCLKELINEAKRLEDDAYYCSQNHTILLNKRDNSKNYDDPLNMEVTSDKGCVPHDMIGKNSKLNLLYFSPLFKKFLQGVLKLNNIYPYHDSLSSINYNYYQKQQQLGWHFDNASFAITLMIQSSEIGGDFEYVSKGRDYSKNLIDKLYLKKILNNEVNTNKIRAEPGTLVLFYGRNYLHRVTPVLSDKPRILVTLNYNEEEGIELSENARKTFFGRIN